LRNKEEEKKEEQHGMEKNDKRTEKKGKLQSFPLFSPRKNIGGVQV
jgi:hypothetical protein